MKNTDTEPQWIGLKIAGQIWPRKNELENRCEEIIQNIGERNRKCERLRDTRIEREGLMYIQYVPQKELGEHGGVREYWGFQDSQIIAETSQN